MVTCHRNGRAALLLGGAVLATSMATRADTIDTTGQAPYEQCGYCHEYDGNPRMPKYPRLAGQWPQYIKKQLQDFRSGARSGEMQATAELLTDQDIDVVAGYFSSQAPRPLVLPAQPAAEIELAKRLYFEGDGRRNIMACATCHGDQGGGDGRAEVPVLAGQQLDYLRTQLQLFQSGARGNDPAQLMRGIAAELTSEEVGALAGYLARLSPKTPSAASAAMSMTASEGTRPGAETVPRQPRSGASGKATEES